MRSLVIAALLLGGCATTAEPPIAVHGETLGHMCNTTAVADYTGQVATAQIAAELVAKSRALVLRWAPPGVMLTMDYRSDRLTARLSADNHILALNCG